MNDNRKNRESYHHGNLKESLINEGLKILSEIGVDGLSLRVVAKNLGVSVSSMYRHFKNKKDLINHISAKGFTKLSDKMKNSIISSEKGSLDKFKQTSWAYVEFAFENPDYFKIMFSRDRGDGDISPVNDISLSTIGVVIDIIKVSQDNGLIKKDDPKKQALAAWSMIHGLTNLFMENMLSDVKNDKNKMKELTFSLAETLYDGLKP